MVNSATAGDAPSLLNEDGSVPETRMADAAKVSNRVQEMLRSDRQGRAQRRALVKGLVDGNPPYRSIDLVNAGRANQCNVNWRIAEKYLNGARAGFWDVFSEAPTYATVVLDEGPADFRAEISGIVTEEFEWLQKQEPCFEAQMTISQYEMVLYGIGPLMFQDENDWRAKYVLCKDLLLPEMAKSDPGEWEEVAILKEYRPDELYGYIRNESAARKMGWNIESVQKAIINASPISQKGGEYRSWEFHQQQLKNNSFQYSAESAVIAVAHYLFREFPEAGESVGKITHTIVTNPENAEQQGEFLFRKSRRFDDWLDIVHPMYYDNDGGGYHHSVTGMGVKMYSAMSFQNKLICNQADKAFAPKVLFKPNSASANEQWSMVTWGDYGRIPPGFEMLQVPVGSWLQDGMVFNRDLTSLIANNLSQYQSNITKDSGNPITATEMQFRASDQARLGKTQLTHYYAQLDKFYDRKFRRAVRCPEGMPGGKLAAEFRRRCAARNVNLDLLKRCGAKATRIVGQGSQFVRQSSLRELMGLAPMLNERGRNNLISDFVASHAGQAMVGRYNPSAEIGAMPEDQQVLANLQVASAKTGVQPVVASNQNPAVFATAFTIAAGQAVESVGQGGDPVGAVQFVRTIQPAAMQHIQKLSMDKTRKGMVDSMVAQWREIDQQTAQLEQQIQQAQQQQMEQQQAMAQAQAINAGVDPELMLKQAEQNAKLSMQQQKTNAAIAMKQQKHAQSMALSDASTAAEMSRQTAMHRQQMEQNNDRSNSSMQ